MNILQNSFCSDSWGHRKPNSIKKWIFRGVGVVCDMGKAHKTLGLCVYNNNDNDNNIKATGGGGG